MSNKSTDVKDTKTPAATAAAASSSSSSAAAAAAATGSAAANAAAPNAAAPKAATAKPAILGYWKIRGLAEPIRQVLEYTGTPYVNQHYVQGEAPNFSREEWLKDKFNLGLTFPNLPFYVDEKVKLTQSDAILNYIGRQHGLTGSTVQEQAIVDMVLGEAYDIRSVLTGMCYSSRFTELAQSHFTSVFPKTVAELAAVLGTKEWFCGALSVADFVLHEAMSVARAIEPKALDTVPTLQAWMKRFEALPAIVAYMKSDRYLATGPFNNKIAAFGGQPL